MSHESQVIKQDHEILDKLWRVHLHTTFCLMISGAYNNLLNNTIYITCNILLENSFGILHFVGPFPSWRPPQNIFTLPSSEVQSKVLPKYGFRGDLKGVFDMLEPRLGRNHWGVMGVGMTQKWSAHFFFNDLYYIRIPFWGDVSLQLTSDKFSYIFLGCRILEVYVCWNLCA